MIRVGIVIPTYNRLCALKRCLSSLSWCEHRDEAVVVVVDSGSTDGTEEYLRHAPDWVIHVPGSSEMWWTACVESGARVAGSLGATHVMTLNDDCTLNEESFDACLGVLADGRKVCVCPRVVEMTSGETIAQGGRIEWTGRLALINGRESGLVAPEARNVDWCGGIGFAFPLSAWLEVSGYDCEAFPHYYGDADFSIRVRRAGYRLVYCAEFIVPNDKATTATSVPKHGARLWHLREALTSRRSWANLADTYRFYRKHAGTKLPLAMLAVYVPYLMSATKRIALSSLPGRRT